MIDQVFWITGVTSGGLGTMARPRGGEWLDADLAMLVRAGVDVLVSALEPHEVRDLELDQEAARCREVGIRFVSFAIPDRGVPSSPEDFVTVTSELMRFLAEGEAVVAHCRAGIGRSSLLAAGVLAHQGVTPHDAFAAIREARGLPVPDVPEQASWLERVVASRYGECSPGLRFDDLNGGSREG